jgi:hypothetical protein
MSFGRLGTMGRGFGSLGGLLGSAGGGGGPVAPLTLPGTPAAVYSSVRLNSWGGAWGRVVRASDGVQQDIGFVGNVVDTASLLTFQGASSLTLATLYDQSGNANDLTQSTAANRPSVTTLNTLSGVLPVTFDGNSGGALTVKYLTIPDTLSFDRTAMSAFEVLNPIPSRSFQGPWEFANAGAAKLTLFYDGSGGMKTYDGVTIFNSPLVTRGQLTTIALRSSGAAQAFTVNGSAASAAAMSSLTLNGGGSVGRSITSTNYNVKNDLFALVFYGSAVDDATHNAALAALNTAFTIPSSFTSRLIYGGSSLLISIGATLNRSFIRQMAFDSNVEIFNMGVSGQSLATEYANRSTETGLYDSSKAANIFVIDAPSNDISSQAPFASQAAAESYADTLYSGTTLPFVSAIKALGADAYVIVPTIIARGSFAIGGNNYEYARLRYNANVVAGAAANGYTCSDRASDSRLGATGAAANTTWFLSDQIHPTTAGYGLMAAIEGPIVKALVQ